MVTFGTLSHSSRAVVETGVCVRHRPIGGLSFNGGVQFSWIIRRKQIFNFVHIVEVSDSARDRLQGLHHCFFGWRTSSRLQLFEVCVPLSQRQQQLRLVSARDGLGKPLVKRCRVLSCARIVSLCNTLKIAQLDGRPAPRRSCNISLSMLKQISCASCRSAAPCQIHWVSQNFLRKFCLKLWADRVRPHPQPDSEPVLPRFGWRQTARLCRSWHFRKFDSRNVSLAGSSQHSCHQAQLWPHLLLRATVELSGLFESQLWKSGFTPSPGHGGGTCDDAVP